MHCIDCWRFFNDNSCMFVDELDIADKCNKFIDKRYMRLLDILNYWKSKNINYKEMINKAIEEIENE